MQRHSAAWVAEMGLNAILAHIKPFVQSLVSLNKHRVSVAENAISSHATRSLYRGLTSCCRSQLNQAFGMILYGCCCQRFAPHDFEHIQTVIDLFQSLFHRLQIAL